MPEEKAPKTTEAPAAPAQPKAEKPRTFTKFIIIVTIIGLMQVVASFFLVQKFLVARIGATEAEPAGHEEKTTESTHAEPVKRDHEGKAGEALSINDLVINPAGTEGKRYLSISLTVVLDASTHAKDVQEKMPVIKDKLLDLLSSKTVADLADVSLRQKLREELLLAINQAIAPGRVLKIYVTNFILQ